MDNNLTEVIFLLDRSGSMAGLESDTIGGFNGFIKKQQEMEGKTIVTAVLFDDRYEILWNGINAKKAVLTDKNYYVRGATALLDAIGETILDVGYRLSITEKSKQPNNVIFVIATDGLENSSREFTYGKVKELINHQQEKYGWEFIFLGANIDVSQEANNLGININNSYCFEATQSGIEQMYYMVNEEIGKIRYDKNN